jgi:hypothetical protein
MKTLIALALAVGSMALPLRAADPPAATPGATAPNAIAPNAIVGMWQLVAATPVAPAAIDPHGMLNQKLYFSKDGKIFLLRPDEKLTADIPSAPYSFDGKTRKVTLPDGQVRTDPARISGDSLSVTMPDGQQLTYRRVTGPNAAERRFAPLSVETVSGSSSPTEPKYDEADYSKQPLAERVRGVWEVVRYAKLSGEVPEHGFANDKYVIDGKQVAILVPGATTAGDRRPYDLADDSMLVKSDTPETWSVSFNEWQQLVLTRNDAEVTLRLVQKPTSPIPALPTRIALVE